MASIKLMNLLYEALNEIGDLQNITPYEYKKINSLNYIFYANINGEKVNVKVWFENIEDAILDASPIMIGEAGFVYGLKLCDHRMAMKRDFVVGVIIYT